jgi:hypothetical protein
MMNLVVLTIEIEKDDVFVILLSNTYFLFSFSNIWKSNYYVFVNYSFDFNYLLIITYTDVFFCIIHLEIKLLTFNTFYLKFSFTDCVLHVILFRYFSFQLIWK